MATYLELKQQAQRLLVEAEELRVSEVAQVISEIQQKMQDYGLTLADLGNTKPTGKTITPSPVKYRGPNGKTWVGGKGRKPDWILEALAQGKDIDKEFGV